MSLKKEAPSAVTLLQIVIFAQFGASFFITILTTIGIAFTYPVASYYLMALLQVLVAIPGIVYVAMQGNLWIAIYISFQAVTACCEIYWLIYMIFDDQSAGRWVGLACLTAINVAAVVIALWFRNTELKVPCKKKNKNKDKEMDAKVEEEKPKMKAPSASMSEVEKASPQSSKSTSSIKKSANRSSELVTDKSSKGSLKIRKTKKTNSSLPLDSRETTSISRSIKSSSSTAVEN